MKVEDGEHIPIVRKYCRVLDWGEYAYGHRKEGTLLLVALWDLTNVQQGQDICIFCALRLETESSPRGPRPFRQIRSYNSNVALRRPGAAQAAEKDDDAHYTPPVRYERGSPFGARQNYPQRTTPQQQQGYQRPRQEAATPSYRPSLDRPAQQGYQRPRQQAGTQPGRSHSDGLVRRVEPSRPAGGRVLTGFEAFEQATRSEKSSQAQKKSKVSEPFQQQTRPPPRPFQQRQPRDFNEPFREPFAQQRPRSFEGRQPRDSQDSYRGTFRQQPREDLGRSRAPAPNQPAIPEPVDDDDVEIETKDDGLSGQKRRGPKKVESREERRSHRFALDDEEETVVASMDQKKPSVRIDPMEQEMEDIEAELYGTGSRRKRKKKERPAVSLRPQVELPEYISVQNLAVALNVRPHLFLQKLEEEGYAEARQDHILDASTSAMFAELYGFEPIITQQIADKDLVARPPAEDQSLLPPRPPVVTIMGHVDHGKTTILDWLRKSSVVQSEHGGITQHIGAFSVTMPVTKKQITFLDTPGHAAFLDMRKRGAIVTDIVVLVVAADDGVKPQTKEAIKHATDADVQIIVAINKIDKEDAYVEKVWQDLAREGINVEDYGGDTQAIPISGKTGQGMDALEEAIVTLADISDFRAELDGPAEGWVIESKVTSAGRVATVLVRRGTLRIGDFIVAGSTWARVRTLRNDAGQLVSEAPPGTPVQVDGWRGEDPTAGLEVLQAENEQHAKDVVELRIEKGESVRAATDTVAINKSKADEAEAYAKVRAWREEQGFGGKKLRRAPRASIGWQENAAQSGTKEVAFVVKADVAGSAEAIAAAVSAIGNHEVAADVVRSETGHVSESDIKLLAATGEIGYVISFNQPIDATMYRLAEAAGVRILDHNIIYKVTDDVKEKLSDELPPLITQRVLGEAEIGKIFDITVKRKTMKVAGCKITNGTISRSQKVRVLRKQEVIYTGKQIALLWKLLLTFLGTLESLKNVKKDVTEMRKGSECGMSFDNWEDFREGDQIQSVEEISEKRKLY